MKSLVEYAAGYFQNFIKERGILKDTHNGIKHFVFIPAPLQIFSMMTLDINYGIHAFRLNRDYEGGCVRPHRNYRVGASGMSDS